eukprot:scaffold121984_cov72-Phaeocystis_antarctica.AAC.2
MPWCSSLASVATSATISSSLAATLASSRSLAFTGGANGQSFLPITTRSSQRSVSVADEEEVATAELVATEARLVLRRWLERRELRAGRS